MPFGKWILQVVPEEAEAYFERVKHLVIPNIQRLLDCFRLHEAPIAYTEFGSLLQDGRDMPGWARRNNEMAEHAVRATSALNGWMVQ